MGKLKLYVWEDVLEDRTCGIMFALAYNVDQARYLIAEKMDYISDDLELEPKIYGDPAGFYVYGGG